MDETTDQAARHIHRGCHQAKNPATLEQVNAKLKDLQAEYDALQYQRDRALAFPSWQEQLDLQYWDKKNGTKKWEETIDKVKADHPKPE